MVRIVWIKHILSSILGIGGGTFSVPYFKASGLNLTSAIGTSAACGVPIAIFGTLGYVIAGINKDILPPMSFGYVYLPAKHARHLLFLLHIA